MGDLTELLTIRQAAERLNRCYDTVRQWVNQGRLPSVQVGPMRLVRREDVEALASRLEPVPQKGRPRTYRG